MKIRVKRSEICKSILEAVTGNKVDKYGNTIPKYGQGWGADDTLFNRQGYNQDGSKGPWFSRSVAVATAVILNDNGRWYVLAGQRGTGTPDYQGYWNLPCGYLDYNEDAQNAAAREVYEETGIKLNPDDLKYFGNSTSPYENRQNVVFFYVAFITGSVNDFPFSKENMEENEVDGIQWLPIEDCGKLKWAFDHDELVKKILQKYSYKINGGENVNNPLSAIEKAINVLSSDGDTDYAINLLMQAKKLLK
jgi:8-oxo-dGTP pyrophosphatase MutT (NUDIX family)